MPSLPSAVTQDEIVEAGMKIAKHALDWLEDEVTTQLAAYLDITDEEITDDLRTTVVAIAEMSLLVHFSHRMSDSD